MEGLDISNCKNLLGTTKSKTLSSEETKEIVLLIRKMFMKYLLGILKDEEYVSRLELEYYNHYTNKTIYEYMRGIILLVVALDDKSQLKDKSKKFRDSIIDNIWEIEDIPKFEKQQIFEGDNDNQIEKYLEKNTNKLCKTVMNYFRKKIINEIDKELCDASNTEENNEKYNCCKLCGKEIKRNAFPVFVSHKEGENEIGEINYMCSDKCINKYSKLSSINSICE